MGHRVEWHSYRVYCWSASACWSERKLPLAEDPWSHRVGPGTSTGVQVSSLTIFIYDYSGHTCVSRCG